MGHRAAVALWRELGYGADEDTAEETDPAAAAVQWAELGSSGAEDATDES